MSRMKLYTHRRSVHPTGSAAWTEDGNLFAQRELAALAVKQVQVKAAAQEWAKKDAPAGMLGWFEEFGQWCADQLYTRTWWEDDLVTGEQSYHTRLGSFPLEWRKFMAENDDGLGDDADHEEEL